LAIKRLTVPVDRQTDRQLDVHMMTTYAALAQRPSRGKNELFPCFDEDIMNLL